MKDMTITRRKFLKRSCAVASLPVLNATTVAMANDMIAKSGAVEILTNRLGFNGERLDSVLKSYHLGQGYRVYNPKNMGFMQADLLSPFNEGGINAFAYCNGDPINLADPSGFSANIGNIVGNSIAISLGIVTVIASVLMAPFTGGASLLCMSSAIAGIASGVLGVASGALGVAGSLAADGSAEQETLFNLSAGFGASAAIVGVVSFSTAAISALGAGSAAAGAARQGSMSLSSAIGGITSDGLSGSVGVASMIARSSDSNAEGRNTTLSTLTNLAGLISFSSFFRVKSAVKLKRSDSMEGMPPFREGDMPQGTARRSSKQFIPSFGARRGSKDQAPDFSLRRQSAEALINFGRRDSMEGMPPFREGDIPNSSGRRGSMRRPPNLNNSPMMRTRSRSMDVLPPKF